MNDRTTNTTVTQNQGNNPFHQIDSRSAPDTFPPVDSRMISTPVRPITQDYTSNPFNHSNATDVPDEFPEVQEQTHNNYSDESIISLRTIPVVLENGRRRMKINTLLDDGSTKTYINSDVAHELGVHGKQKTIAVGVLGGRNSFVKGEEVTLTLISILKK